MPHVSVCSEELLVKGNISSVILCWISKCVKSSNHSPVVLKQTVNIYEKEHKNPTQCPHVSGYSIHYSVKQQRGVCMLHVNVFLFFSDAYNIIFTFRAD